MHIPNTWHGFLELEFDKSLFRQWLAKNGYIKVYLMDVTTYTAYIPVYTQDIYCQTPPLLWIRLVGLATPTVLSLSYSGSTLPEIGIELRLPEHASWGGLPLLRAQAGLLGVCECHQIHCVPVTPSLPQTQLADSLFHASCILCIKTLLILWLARISIPLIMLLLWTNGWLYHLPQGCITMRSTRSWSEICWSQWCILGYTDMSSTISV
jgi:hypothetical protein